MTRRSGMRGAGGGLPVRLAEVLLTASSPPDLALWGTLLFETVHLRIATRPIVMTRDEAVVELAGFLGAISAIGSGFWAIRPAQDAQTVLVEADFTLAIGGPPLPLALVLRAIEPEPLVRDLRLYLDPTPLGLAPVGANAHPVAHL